MASDRSRSEVRKLLEVAMEAGRTEQIQRYLKRLQPREPHPRPQQPRRANGTPATPDWVRHTVLARELGLDPRTLWGAIATAPYARQVSERIKIIHRPRFYAELERGLRLPEGRGR